MTSGTQFTRLLLLLLAVTFAQGQKPAAKPLPDDAGQFIRAVIQNEISVQENDRSHWMYKLHREDEKNVQDRQVIETMRGNLARTLVLNGHSLTPEERARDDERMRKLVNDPKEQARIEQREHDDAQQAQLLLKAFPAAFVFKYDGEDADLVRLKFTPNPHYSPPNRKLAVLHSLAGTLWVDPAALHVAKIEGRLFEDVNLLLGLGHLDKGGAFGVVQKNIGDGHWEIVSLDLNMHGRAVFFKTISVKQKQTFSGFQRVRDDLTFAQAYEMLHTLDQPAVAARPQQGATQK
ncbi:MAG TPA: hypothetical protein VNW97_15280 [Candidatus Saccharimonadales bacterium]|nr:hypothetical protein [Candidatus Saccharimonadales bacterium]